MVRHKSTGILRALRMALVMTCCIAGAWTTPALADQGSITISQRHNTGAAYNAYLVFCADVSTGDEASNISWPSEQTKEAVLAFLDENGYPSWLEGKGATGAQHDIAQNAAEYVAMMISGSEEDLGAATTPRTTEGRSFTQAFARFLSSQDIDHASATSGELFEGEQGLWLFVTDTSSLDAENESGTAPLWVPLGGSATQVEEKSAVPSLTFEVQEDSTGSWGRVADGSRRQSLPHRLTGTLPATFDSFATYHYRFDVTLPEGMEVDIPQDGHLAQALSIRIGDQEATIDGEELSTSYENGRLVVDFADLRSDWWADFGIDKDTIITVAYRAYLDGAAIVGVPGNACTAQLIYTSDPVSETEVASEVVDVAVFTYQMSLIKVSAQTKDKLKDAAFTLQVAKENTDAASAGLYVQQDGSLGTPIHVFTTGEDGMFSISGLDEGTYLLNEISAPKGYQVLQDSIALVIESELSGTDRSLKGFKVSASSKAKTSVEVLPDKGVLTLTVENVKEAEHTSKDSREALAQTGVGPIAASLVLAGFSMLLISVPRKRR